MADDGDLRPHHSIGEVLALLKTEYSDITISKIRFLESQGLIDPERTPSGYRKFYDDDIERLRWILTQQRDNFLPLKVIKRRLEDAGFELAKASVAPDGPMPEPTLFTRREPEPAADPDGDGGDAGEVADTGASDVVILDEPEVGVPEVDVSEVDLPEVDVPDPVEVGEAPPVAEGDPLESPGGSVSLTGAELAAAADVDVAVVTELDRLGLIVAIGEGAAAGYDHEALVVTSAAAAFAARGVEPRHLRMFKIAAEREAGILTQLSAPLASKGVDSAAQLRAELNELVRLGETIHRSVLRRSLGPSID